MKIETERLIIRPWTLDDVPHYRAMATDVGYNCFSPPGIFLVEDDAGARAKIQERIARYEQYGLSKWPMFERRTGTFVGTCGGDPFALDGVPEVELGYRLMLAHWGQGYATEAARAMADHLLTAVDPSTGTRRARIYGFAIPQNPGSLKILEKVGFQYLREFIWAGLPHRLYQKQPSDAHLNEKVAPTSCTPS